MNMYVLVMAGFILMGGTPNPSGEVMGVYTKESECVQAKEQLEKNLTPENISPAVTAIGIACVKIPVNVIVPKEAQVKT